MALLPPPTQASSSVGQAAVCSSDLRARFLADDAMKIAHHHRIRMRARARSPAGNAWSATFVTQSRMASLMASFSVRLPLVTADDLRAQQPHAEDVQALPAHVFFAHVDHALEAEQRAHRGGGDAVLARRRFRR